MKPLTAMRPGWRLLRLCVAAALLTAGLPPLAAAPDSAPVAVGDLDPTFAGFGAGGKVITDIMGGYNDAHAVALQPDGKIIVAGSAGAAFVVARYHDNGALDQSFGGGGYTRTPLGGASIAYAVALQPDGRIVIAGYVSNAGNADFAVARYTADGALDASFGGGDGIVTTDFNGGDDRARGVVVQGDGKIVAAGFAIVSGAYDFALVRYCANGALDDGVNCGAGGFGSHGEVTTGFGHDDRAYALTLQADGKLVAAGQVIGNPGSEFALARYCPDGRLDNGSNCGSGGFDGDGKLSTLIEHADGARAVAIQTDGKIVAAGISRAFQGTNDFALVRYCPNGSRDNGSNCGAGGFGSDGKVKTHISGSDAAEAHAVAVRADGVVIAAGFAQSILGTLFVTQFYAPNGSVGSLAITDIASGNDSARALALQPDGRAVVAGAGNNGSNDDFVLIRLWHDGALDTGGRQTLGFDDPLFGPGSREFANALAIQPDNKIVIAGQIMDAGASDTDFALARFLADGRLDGAFGDNGRVVYGFGGDQYAKAVAIQPDGKIVVAGYTSAANGINFMLVRFNPNGTPDGGFGFGGFNVLDFMGGADYGLSLALASDGKLVVGGTAYNGARHVFGVARFTDAGIPDDTFDGDGKQLYEFSVGPAHWGAAVLVQPDRKIVLGGHVGADFALVRLTEAGQVDTTFGTAGQTITDMGGNDSLGALLLTPGGWFVAAGMRITGAGGDFALAQFDPNGLPPMPGPRQPWAKAYINWGPEDGAFALDWRGDGQIVAAGCAGGQFAWAQLPSNALLFTPITATVNFPGNNECALGVKFTGWNKIITVGYHTLGNDANFALARFDTTQGPPPKQLFLPFISR